MNILRELVQIVTSNLPQKDFFDKESGYYQIFTGIIEGKFESDAEAARTLYGTDASDVRFRMLKSRFRKKLLSYLFFLDISKPKFNDYSIALYECRRGIFNAKLLRSLGAHYSPVRLAKKTLNKAREFHFTDIALECLDVIQSYYSRIGAEKEFEHYTLLAIQLRELANSEAIAKEYYQRITIKLSKSVSKRQDLERMVDQYCAHIARLCHGTTSHTLILYNYRLQSIKFQLTNDYEQSLALYYETEHFYKDKPQFSQASHFAELAQSKMIAFLNLRDYENGRRSAEECLEMIREGSNNWFLFLRLYFLLTMHSEHYDKAAEIFNKVVNHPRFNSNPARLKEIWKVFESYLRYIIESEPASASMPQEPSLLGNKFMVYKFLNEVPLHSQDKRGTNVAIIVVHILFLLERGETDAILDKTEAIRTYASRYLKKEEHYRSNCFLQMLRITALKNFDLNRTKAATKKYYEKMTSRPVQYVGSPDSLEVISYEQLWERVLKRLETMEKDGLIVKDYA